MHDVWNPWHGCIKKSEGCQNCYMYELDRQRGQNGSNIYKVKGNFDYPLQRNRDGSFKVKSGEMLRVCMSSDFFLQEADVWRDEAWAIIKKRPDIIFFLITKRPERIPQCLPKNWEQGWRNVFLNVTTENQLRADERIPILLKLPFVHKGLMVTPFIGKISITSYLKTGQIDQVIAGGENYNDARPLHFSWVKSLYEQCFANNVRFCFIETGNKFVKDGKLYNLKSKRLQRIVAYKSGLQFGGKAIDFDLTGFQTEIFDANEFYEKYWSEPCQTCGAKLICNGCQKCKTCRFEDKL